MGQSRSGSGTLRRLIGKMKDPIHIEGTCRFSPRVGQSGDFAPVEIKRRGAGPPETLTRQMAEMAMGAWRPRRLPVINEM
jgi:hypothetical protein